MKRIGLSSRQISGGAMGNIGPIVLSMTKTKMPMNHQKEDEDIPAISSCFRSAGIQMALAPIPFPETCINAISDPHPNASFARTRLLALSHSCIQTRHYLHLGGKNFDNRLINHIPPAPAVFLRLRSP
jgi:hypothetical protein